VIGGVCAGVARYLGVDSLVVRIVAVALVFVAGLGVLLYVGALLLVPDDDGRAYADTDSTRGRLLTAVGVVALVAAAAVVLSGALLGSLAVLVPLAVLALAGLFVWWLVSGEGLGGDWKVILRRSALGLGLLIVCAAIFAGGIWATGAGGGTVTASLVIAAGVAVLVGAFLRPVRWLVLPAVSLGLAVGVASAVDLDLDGGVGERNYTPSTAADLRDRYELGVGQLVVDLREADLPKGDVPLEMKLGMGDAVLVVPEDVCVASTARLGGGDVQVFERNSSGIDVHFEDLRAASPSTTRVVVDADVGFGAFEVRHNGRPVEHGPGADRDARGNPGNRACLKANEA
jgi:phage shock protein PspC (stress-responsive transcriptional regulator)